MHVLHTILCVKKHLMNIAKSKYCIKVCNTTTKRGVSLTAKTFDASMSTRPKRLSVLLKENGLTENDLKQKMKEEHCRIIAKEIGKDWQSLATFIGVSDVDVDDIKEQYQEPQDRRSALLRKWKKLYASEATYAKMVDGLDKTGNRELTECLIGLLKHTSHVHVQNQKGINETSQYITPMTGKRKFQCNIECRYFLALGVLMLIHFIFLIILINWPTTLSLIPNTHLNSTPPQTPPTRTQSNFMTYTMVQWSPKFHTTINCSRPIGHDLPLSHSLFVGREEDIKQVKSKIIKANILNINGAPAFGKSTVAIHAGYRLVEDCIPVRYINMEEISQTLPEFTMSKSDSKTKGKSDSKCRPIKQTTALTNSPSTLLAKESSESSTVRTSYIKDLIKWSQVINHTTVLIFDNADDVLAGSFREGFIDLISLLVYNSQNDLHVIVVSQEKLFLVEKFDRWIIRELSKRASIELLDTLAPSFSNNQLERIAELVEGFPLALKFVGNVLNEYGQDIIYELEKELQQQPLDVLDRVSNHRQRFRAIMDLVFSKLEYLKCGYMVSLFPGSFSSEAGIAVLSSKQCLESFQKQSLLDEYFLGYQHRYKMHRLIREYVKEQVMDKSLFHSRFCKYYTQFLLTYAKESELNDIDEHILSSESKNFDMFEKQLLSRSRGNFSIEELAALVFLASKGYVQRENLQSKYKLYLKTLNQMIELLNPVIYGELTSHVVKHFYIRCECKTITEYFQNMKFFKHPCRDIFDCELITQIYSMHSFLNLSRQEEEFLYNVQTYNCLKNVFFVKNVIYFLCKKSFTSIVIFLITYGFGILYKWLNLGHLDSSTISQISQNLIKYYTEPFDDLLAIEIGMKLLCYTSYIILPISIFIYLRKCHSSFHLFNLCQQCTVIFIFIVLTFLFLATFFFDMCSKLPICH